MPLEAAWGAERLVEWGGCSGCSAAERGREKKKKQPQAMSHLPRRRCGGIQPARQPSYPPYFCSSGPACLPLSGCSSQEKKWLWVWGGWQLGIFFDILKFFFFSHRAPYLPLIRFSTSVPTELSMCAAAKGILHRKVFKSVNFVSFAKSDNIWHVIWCIKQCHVTKVSLALPDRRVRQKSQNGVSL